MNRYSSPYRKLEACIFVLLVFILSKKFLNFLSRITFFYLGQVSSALYCLRQRNTYQGNMALAWSKPGTNFVEFGNELSFDRGQTIESGPHVNEIIDSSRTKARAMVDAAMQVYL